MVVSISTFFSKTCHISGIQIFLARSSTNLSQQSLLSRKLCLISHHEASKPFSRPSFLAAIWWMKTTTLGLILASLQSCLRYILSWPSHWMAAATAYFLSGQFMREDFMGALASCRPALEQK